MDVILRSDGSNGSCYREGDVQVQRYRKDFPGMSISEHWVTAINVGTNSVRINTLDSFSLEIPSGNYELMYFTSDWGQEFEPIRVPLDGHKTLCNRAGRSSKNMHPWFSLVAENGDVVTGTVMWSGNWIVRFEPLDGGGYRIRGGLDDWEFHKELKSGESMEGPHVAVAFGKNGDLNETSIQLARAGRDAWYPSVDANPLPVEWNHWWSYEDKFITEEAFKQNVDVAAELGFELCTLDAGWFGPADSSTFWEEYRGDWDLVNANRFPSGIRALSDYTHAKGLKFGLWCEIEALGKKAMLGHTHPEFTARRDEQPLGYVCFGNPEAEEWAYQTLTGLIDAYRPDWIKLDFNLDPGAGCNRTDHGHGAGDGLYGHYQGYYRVLDRIRREHPHVILENCSSGGLRIDLGMLTHTHTTFLSDKDWPLHNLQVFWGASTMLAPDVCLHWGNSEWIQEQPNQTFDPHDAQLRDYQIDFYVHTSMLGGMGFSQKLPELPMWIRDRYRNLIQTYQQLVAPFVRHADVYRLTAQPIRNSQAGQWAGFQYAMPDSTEHLVFSFRLQGAKPAESMRLNRLNPSATYQLTWIGRDKVTYNTGDELMEDGLMFEDLREEESCIVHIRVVQ